MATQEGTATGELQVQPIYIIVEKHSNKKSVKESYQKKAAGIIGIIHILCGLVAFGTGVGLIFSNSLKFVVCGILSSVFFFISGGLSIGSCRSGNSCLVAGTLVMSIFSAICAGILILSGIDLGVGECSYFYSSYYCNDVTTVLYWLQVLTGITEMILAITSSSLSCKAICCREKQDTSVPSNRVIYKPSGDANITTDIASLALLGRQITEPNGEDRKDLPKYEDLVGIEEGTNFDYQKF